MSTATLLNGFRVYKDYKSKDSYYRDFRRRKRDLDVIESRFASLLGCDDNSQRYTTSTETSTSLRSECYALFDSLSSDPETLAQFKKLVGNSLVIDGLTTDRPFKVKNNGDDIVTLLRFLFKKLSQKYEEAGLLNDAIALLKEEQLELGQCLLDSYKVNNLQTRIAILTDEKIRLNNDILELYQVHGLNSNNSEESHLRDLNDLSTAYQNLYDEYLYLQHELHSANLKNDNLSKRLFDVESDVSMQYFINGLYPPEFGQLDADFNDTSDDCVLEIPSDGSGDDSTEIDIFATDDGDSKNILEAFRFYKSGLMEEKGAEQQGTILFNSDNEYNDMARKLDEYKRENQTLRIENETLSSQKYSTDEIIKQNNATVSGFATLGQLFHQITNSLESFNNPETSGHANSAKTYTFQNEEKLHVLDYENKAFRSKLIEVYEDLHKESSSNFSLQRQLSQIKMELDHAKEAFFNLENLNVVILRNEEELNLLKSNKELYLEQLNSMQNEVTALTEEKHSLLLKLRTFETMNESNLRECGILREEISKLRAIVNGNFSSHPGIRDKLSKIELESNCKLLEDKLSRARIEASNLHNANGQLLSSVMELRRELERERYENAYYSKQISSYIANEGKIRVQLDHYTNQIETLTASLEASNDILKSRSAELSVATDKLFEKDCQILNFEARMDVILSFYMKLVDMINQALPIKLSDTSISILESVQFDSTYYNSIFEAIQQVSITVNDEFDNNSLSQGLNKANHKICNIINFNYITSTLAISLCKELHRRNVGSINTSDNDAIISNTRELAEKDATRVEYISKISKLEAQISELQNVNKLNQKFTWENSMQRITEKYEKSSEELKFMLKECNNLINLNEMALESLRKDNTRLLSDHTNAANVIIEYQDRLNSNINERNVLKEVLYSIIPESLREVCDKDDPMGNIKALGKHIESLKLDRSINVKTDISRQENIVLDYKHKDECAPSYYKDDTNRQNIIIDELVSNVDYYYRFIKDSIRTQIREISDYTDGETDFESPLNVAGKFSDDTIYDDDSDDSDSSYDYINADDISKKHTKHFELIIKLLDKLKCAYSSILPKRIADVSVEEKPGMSVPGDLEIIRHLSQLCSILKEMTHGTPRQFHLDDIVYQMETLPTSTDSLDRKSKTWSKCVSSIVSVATEVLTNRTKERGSELEEVLLRYNLTKRSLEEIQTLSQIQNKELRKRNTDICEMENRIEELQNYCRKIESELEISKGVTNANDRDYHSNKQQDIHTCIKQIKKLETIIIELEEVNGLLNQQLESSKLEINRLNSTIDDQNKRIYSLNNKISKQGDSPQRYRF